MHLILVVFHDIFAALEFPCCVDQKCVRMAVLTPIADVMKELAARYEWDPAFARVLLSSKGVYVRKLSDFMCAFADEKDPASIQLSRLSASLTCGDGAGQQTAPSHHRAQES